MRSLLLPISSLIRSTIRRTHFLPLLSLSLSSHSFAFQSSPSSQSPDHNNWKKSKQPNFWLRLPFSFSMSTAASSSVSGHPNNNSNNTNGDNNPSDSRYDYDLIVIGGGSGGLASAKEVMAVNPNLRVAVFDLVTPTVHGTKWGLGGTCVNVGCIPKKLMHHAGSMGYLLHDHAPQFGWQGLESVHHDWSTMSSLIGDYIKSLNFSYRVGLQSANVKYFEAYATFIDHHTLSYTTRSGKKSTATFARALIASGGRPYIGQSKGKELAITSDDIFWAKKPPGKTLVCGAGYIALETASFLHHLGYDVSVMIRGEILRKMDRQAGQMIGELMEREGVRFISPATISSLHKVNGPSLPSDARQIETDKWELAAKKANTRYFQYESGARETIDLATGNSTWEIPPGPIRVNYSYSNQQMNDDNNNNIIEEQFDTVIMAIGRKANIKDLNLDAIGVSAVNGKILVDAAEQTTNPDIFAIGDVAIGIPKHVPGASLSSIAEYAIDRPELTPVAIQAGITLARRLYGKSSQLMQYEYIPTSVFTSPSEYGFVGLSEEQASRSIQEGGIGADNVEVFWSRFGNIEISPLHPEYRLPRSNVFLGANLWARRYVEEHKVDWSEATFDTETNAYVTYNPNQQKGRDEEKESNTTSSTNSAEEGHEETAKVINKYRKEDNSIVYDIQLDQHQKIIKGVSGTELNLVRDVEAESAAVFIKSNCLAKLIIDRSRGGRVVGLHFMGPSAGEVVQGFALAVQMGATKSHFDSLVGIHPTAAEEFAVLTVNKKTGQTPLKKAGCGGGSCG